MTRTTPAGACRSPPALQRRRQRLPQRRHLRQQRFALVGQQHVVGVALKQPQRQLLFQRADILLTAAGVTPSWRAAAEKFCACAAARKAGSRRCTSKGSDIVVDTFG